MATVAAAVQIGELDLQDLTEPDQDLNQADLAGAAVDLHQRPHPDLVAAGLLGGRVGPGRLLAFDLGQAVGTAVMAGQVEVPPDQQPAGLRRPDARRDELDGGYQVPAAGWPATGTWAWANLSPGRTQHPLQLRPHDHQVLLAAVTSSIDL